MPFKKDSKVTFELNPGGIDTIIEEGGNTILRLREVSWNGRPHRLELRKWRMNSSNGEELPAQGITFPSPNTPHHIVNNMTRLGFGDTKTVLKNISTRDDFEQSLIETIGQPKVTKIKNTEYEVSVDDVYDPRIIEM